MFLEYRTEDKASEISFICIHHIHDACYYINYISVQF